MLKPSPLQTDSPPSTDSLPEDVVLRVQNVSKKFCRHLKRSMWYGIQDLARNFVGLPPSGWLDASAVDVQRSSNNGPDDEDVQLLADGQRALGLRKSEFWALQDISFDLRRGECLGLIGRNGCGKTTLLRIIAGIFPPDLGEISIRGRVSALIALGAGFHPLMTGRENVYLNGAILGMSRAEIDAKFPKIEVFAEIEGFLDAPVSTYSSGMRVRLGFAVAAEMEPDLLIVDEVLAVGDAAFRRKCYDFFRKLRRRGCAVIIVSHQLGQLATICDRAIVLKQGKIDFTGDAPTGVAHLQDLLEQDGIPTGEFQGLGFSASHSPLEITEVRAYGDGPDGQIVTQQSAHVRIDFRAETYLPRLTCQTSIWLQDQTTLLSLINSKVADFCFSAQSGTGFVELVIDHCPLIPGKYYLKTSIGDPEIPTAYAQVGFETSPVPFRVADSVSAKLSPYERLIGAAVHLPARWTASQKLKDQMC